MFLSEIKIWNFRKFGEIFTGNETLPGLHLQFNKNLNLLVGENDSGKTAIIDAIKYVLHTSSHDLVRPVEEDFHLPLGCTQECDRANKFRIECIFGGFDDQEAKNFLEWLSIGEQGFELCVFLIANRDGSRVTYDCKAGAGEGNFMDSAASDLLRTTYLKPLRDAESEMAPRRGSRISQILDSHDAFSAKDDHELVQIIAAANTRIEEFFNGGAHIVSADERIPEVPYAPSLGKQLHDEIDTYLMEFSDSNAPLSSRFSIADIRLRSILEKLRLSVIETDRQDAATTVDPGLGSSNLLFISAELLLLKKEEYTGLRLALIEEVEAHLHPQAQLRLIEYLEMASQSSRIQLILTTHSPILASKVKLSNIILCKNGNVFPMGESFTLLEKGDYRFLERFLDSTKANMFFAKGVILVEGDAENILVPAIAEILGYPLSKNGLSLVNVGSTAFLRYCKIYRRNTGIQIGIPVAVITDLDIRPDEYKEINSHTRTWSDINVQEEIVKTQEAYDGQGVRTFISPRWTLEYAIALSQNFRLPLLRAILCAQKEENSNRYVVTEEKLAEIDREIEDFERHIELHKLSDEAIAFHIYHQIMLAKHVSKAITAQWLADFVLLDKPRSRSLLESDSSLKYIVDAIKYAARVKL